MLLHDARRDVSPEAREASIRAYLDGTGGTRREFDERFSVLGAMNTMRIMGIFARLVTRDKKPRYDRFQPRLRGLLNETLSHPAMFMVNSAWDRSISLTEFVDLDAVIAWRMGGDGAFHLLDVVGRTIPSLAEILGALEVQAHTVVCYFPTDNLNWQGASVIDENRLPFMVRGDLSLLPSEPFALTPMADF